MKCIKDFILGGFKYEVQRWLTPTSRVMMFSIQGFETFKSKLADELQTPEVDWKLSDSCPHESPAHAVEFIVVPSVKDAMTIVASEAPCYEKSVLINKSPDSSELAQWGGGWIRPDHRQSCKRLGSVVSQWVWSDRDGKRIWICCRQSEMRISDEKHIALLKASWKSVEP